MDKLKRYLGFLEEEEKEVIMNSLRIKSDCPFKGEF